MQLFLIELSAITIATCVLILVPKFASNLTYEGYIVIMVVFTIVQIVLVLLVFKRLTEPVRVLLQAINHVGKQATDLPPPNINLARFERNGLKLAIQTIYDLALDVPQPVADSDTSNTSTASTPAQPETTVALLDTLPCGIIGLDAGGKIAYANRQAPVSIVQNKGQQIQLIFDPGKSIDEWRTEAISSKVRDNKYWSRIADKLPEEDGRRIFDVFASYEKNAASGFETIIMTIDRTEVYQRAEDDTDFIALAAHELRGPITVIRGYLDVLREELEPLMKPDQKELIDRLNVSANRLSGYINNILNVSRYDRRHLQLHLHEITFNEIVTNLWPDLEMRARTQNRLLSANIAPDLPTIAADSNSLSEVIGNLVDNAIKYSNDGGQVILSAQVKENFVECTVQDFGIGIPASVAGNLFSKFYRSHVSRSTVAGTGLGLYISKAIVDSHGGQIWVRSSEGQGSIFGFTVPIYATVADKLLETGGSNDGIIESAHGWIKNHAMVRK